jgi:hypothetical protein
MEKQANPMPANLIETLARHDTAITGLSGRMTGVENGLKTLQGEVHHGFASVTSNVNQQIGAVNHTMNALNSKLDKMDAAPKFDFHRVVGTVVSLAALFAMICGGIIYITTSQTSAVVAEQKAFNVHVGKTLERHDERLDRINQWQVTIERALPAGPGLAATKR